VSAVSGNPPQATYASGMVEVSYLPECVEKGLIMKQMLTITLGLPPKELNPNSRPHWGKKAGATKRYRLESQLVTINEMVRHNIREPFQRLTITPVFYHDTNRRRDGDNALASLKAAFDGLVSAGLVIDDSLITHKPVEFRIDKDKPRVELRIEVVK